MYKKNFAKVRRLDHMMIILFSLAAVSTSVAQILRYTALVYSPVSMVVPLVGTNALFVFPISFLINRRLETFDLRIILGAIAIVVGVFLLFSSA